jgi:hypothetical protein
MRTLTALLAALILSGCASTPRPPNTYGGALPELYRAGTPTTEPYPAYYHRVSHSCTSTPIYDQFGYYVRTDVRCW